MSTLFTGEPPRLVSYPPPAHQADTEKSLEEVMRRYAAMVYRVCYRITRNAHDAEDATQAAFLALHEQMLGDGFEPIRNIGGWLQQVAQRLALDLIRGKKRRIARESVHGSVHPDPAVESDGGESRQIVAEELEELPAKYRLPLILHYFGGMSHQEMAREMNCNSGTLRVRLHRAKQMLAKRLSARGLDMSGCVLAGTLEQIVHRAVTDSIVAQTVHSASRGGALGSGHLAPSAAHLMRNGLVTTQVKLMIGFGALLATTFTAASPMDFGTAAANVIRRLPQRLQSAVQSVTRPMLRAVIPSIQASAVKPSNPPAASQVQQVESKVSVASSMTTTTLPRSTGIFTAARLTVATPLISLPQLTISTPSPYHPDAKFNWTPRPPALIVAPNSNRPFGGGLTWIAPFAAHSNDISAAAIATIQNPVLNITGVGSAPVAPAPQPQPAVVATNPPPKPAQEFQKTPTTITTVTATPGGNRNGDVLAIVSNGHSLPYTASFQGSTAAATFNYSSFGIVAANCGTIADVAFTTDGSWGLTMEDGIPDIVLGTSPTPPPEPVVPRVLPPNNVIQSVPEPAGLLILAGGLCLLRRSSRKPK